MQHLVMVLATMLPLEQKTTRGGFDEASEDRHRTLHHRCSACNPLPNRMDGSSCSDPHAAYTQRQFLRGMEPGRQPQRGYELQCFEWSSGHLHAQRLGGWSVRQWQWQLAAY